MSIFKKSLFAFVLVAGSTFAADMPVGAFTMFPEGEKPEGFCDVGISLVLDRGLVTGDFATLTNFVAGTCELHVPANLRMYKLRLVAINRCQHATYTGTRDTMDGRETITIIDARNSACSTSPMNGPRAPVELIISNDETSAMTYLSY